MPNGVTVAHLLRAVFALQHRNLSIHVCTLVNIPQGSVSIARWSSELTLPLRHQNKYMKILLRGTGLCVRHPDKTSNWFGITVFLQLSCGRASLLHDVLVKVDLLHCIYLNAIDRTGARRHAGRLGHVCGSG